MHFSLIGEILRSGQGKSWSDDSLNGRIRGLIHEQNDPFHGPVLLEVCHEEPRGFLVDSHGSKNYREVLVRVIQDVLVLNKGSLSAELGTDFIMRQTVG